MKQSDGRKINFFLMSSLVLMIFKWIIRLSDKIEHVFLKFIVYCLYGQLICNKGLFSHVL